jgi:hypothetical protein
MSNISSVLSIGGRAWLPGLKPLSNVGINVTRVIEKYLNEVDDKLELDWLIEGVVVTILD